MSAALSLVDDRIAAAFAALARRDAPGAIAAALEAMRLAPRDPRTHHVAARAAQEAGETAIAERHLRIARSLDPGAAPLAGELGDLLRKSGRVAEAEGEYHAALALDAGSIDARIGFLRLQLDAGDVVAAALAGRSLLDLAPLDGAAVSAAAEALIAGRRAEEALAAIDRAVAGTRLDDAAATRLCFMRGDALDRLDRPIEAFDAWSEGNRRRRARCAFDLDAARAARVALLRAHERTPAEAPCGDVAPIRPVLIAGMPRAGTSLLEQMLDAHPAIGGAGELGLLSRLAGRAAVHLGGAWPDAMPDLGADAVAALAEFAREELVAAAPGVGTIIEKTPANEAALPLAARVMPEARVLWCRRDLLDAGLSCFAQDFAGALPWSHDLEDVGRFARLHEATMEAWIEAEVLPIRQVRYEELVAEPERVLRAVLDFLGLPWCADCLAPDRNARIVRTASREQVRRPVYRSSIGRHRRYADRLDPLRRALERPAPSLRDAATSSGILAANRIPGEVAHPAGRSG